MKVYKVMMRKNKFLTPSIAGQWKKIYIILSPGHMDERFSEHRQIGQGG